MVAQAKGSCFAEFYAHNPILIFLGVVVHAGGAIIPPYIASRGKSDTKLQGNGTIVDVRVRAALDELLPLQISGLAVGASFSHIRIA